MKCVVDISTKIDALHEELALIRARLEALEEMLSEEEASEDDRAALEEAMREHERGETIPLDEALRKLKRFFASSSLAELSILSRNWMLKSRRGWRESSGNLRKPPFHAAAGSSRV